MAWCAVMGPKPDQICWEETEASALGVETCECSPEHCILKTGRLQCFSDAAAKDPVEVVLMITVSSSDQCVQSVY